MNTPQYSCRKGGNPLEDYENSTPTGFAQARTTTPRRSRRRWFVLGGLALAFMLALLGVGTHLGATSTAQAAALSSGGSTQSLALAQSSTGSVQTLVVTSNAQPQAGVNNGPQGPAFGPGVHGQGQGQCESLTVSSISGQTIVAKAANGSSVTVHTTSSTKYSQAGKSVSASVIKVGTVIHVMGTHNSDGSITATSIDIG